MKRPFLQASSLKPLCRSPNRVIDTHCHLNTEPLWFERDLWRACLETLTRVVVVGFDRVSSERAMVLASQYDAVYAAIGFHPDASMDYTEQDAAWLRDAVSSPHVVAVGEIGIDLFRRHDTLAVQIDVMCDQQLVARAANKPIIYHCRSTVDTYNAYDVLLPQITTTAADIPAVVHCFGGTKEHALALWNNGFYTGFDGPITYKKNQPLREIAAACPEQLFLAETDAPYLSPEPLRGKFPNLPSRVQIILDHLADVRGLTREQCTAQADANALRLFAGMAPR